MQPGTWCGLVMVFSVRNGEPLAIINDGLLQHMRVGGCAGLGAKYFSRAKMLAMSASSVPAAWRAVISKRFTKCASCGG